jgi:FkbM family methyltransferase
MKVDETIFPELIEVLPELSTHHAPTTATYRLLEKLVREAAVRTFGADAPCAAQFGPLGRIQLPFISMGAITSVELFGLDELILFSFYWTNKDRYRRSIDLGANIGLHSIMMTRCGMQVSCYEPDPTHFGFLTRNLVLNECTQTKTVNRAVSTVAGECEFVRVLGNTTGSHLAGAKENPYGDLERFCVTTDAFAEIAQDVDLVKMDIEGHEAEVLCGTGRDTWRGLDAVVEVGNPTNAERIFHHFSGLGVNLFAQRQGWARVTTAKNMPASYHDGSLFISEREAMPW